MTSIQRIGSTIQIYTKDWPRPTTDTAGLGVNAFHPSVLPARLTPAVHIPGTRQQSIFPHHTTRPPCTPPPQQPWAWGSKRSTPPGFWLTLRRDCFGGSMRVHHPLGRRAACPLCAAFGFSTLHGLSDCDLRLFAASHNYNIFHRIHHPLGQKATSRNCALLPSASVCGVGVPL